MDSQTSGAQDVETLRDLYRQMLDRWNARDADGFAAVFWDDGEVIGFDGSQMNGRAEIAAELARIFADHVTAAYVSKVRSVRQLGHEVGILRAVAGLVPRGQSDINPATNSLQTLVAQLRNRQWRVVLFQNTPAQFHGRPDLAQALTDELRRLL